MSADSNNNSESEWLTPSGALTSFMPSDQLYSENSEAEAEVVRFGFRIGNIGLLLAAGTVSEVVDDVMINPMPATQSWCRGILNLRGDLAPVFDLNILFGTAATDSKPTATDTRRLLILDQGDRSVGILINDLPQTVATDHPLGQLPPLPTELESHVGKSYKFEEEVWLEFDHPSFFTAICKRVAL